MRLLFTIAFRNLFRQKGRSILIGSGVCVAVIYMMLTSSLTRGLYSNVIDKIVESNILGHVTVNILEKDGSKTKSIIRDKDMMVSFIKDKMPDVKEVREAVNTNVFAVGNGEGSMLRLSGVSAPSIETISDIDVISGSLAPFSKGSLENPLILEKHMAETLNVMVGDIVKVRLNTVYGQVQTAQLNLAAIVEYKNPFMSAYMPAAIPFKSLKEIMGYKPNETQSLYITLKTLNKSDEMIFHADKLYKALLQEIPLLGNKSEVDTSSYITGSFPKSWKLADRTYSQAAHEKKLRNIRKMSYNGSIVDVASMQEYDNDTFNGEKGAESIGFIALLIVVSIILVGILNTMRMTIRERTNEIGTVRAIGMQRKTVTRSLVTEVILLSIFAVIIGIFAAIGLMDLISIAQFHPTDLNFSVILNNGHLVFKIPVASIVFNILLVLFLLVISAWLPARKAAKKTVAEALGHNE